ncbi:MAG: UDP-N-acetylglucosamine 1-carboxyvinyltransferase [Thermoguttaceae bacterium]
MTSDFQSRPSPHAPCPTPDASRPSFRIRGGTRLSGTVRVSGSKNAALPMMAAAILASEPVRLEGVPRLLDVETLSQVLRELGVAVTRTLDEALVLETVDLAAVRAGYELVRRMRASFCVLGPLLARRGRAVVSLPGGCNIGPRPVDLHLAGLAALGAELRFEHGYVIAEAKRLVGARIQLAGPQGPTVTGTANVLAAAVLADGETVITGAAVEPEIVDLGRLLNGMGAQIEGLGTPTLRIEGVERLHGTTYRIIPDRIEAATLLLAAAITGGTVTVAGVVPEQLAAVLDKLDQAGFDLLVAKDEVTLVATAPPRPVDLTALPYPGVPSDVQAQWMALLTLARGRSTIGDRVFASRFQHIAELNRLGARIELCGSTAVVTGVDRLTGAVVTASDLRASAALVLAGLAAKGETVIDDIHHLDRGYERLDEKLNQLGAQVERCP